MATDSASASNSLCPSHKHTNPTSHSLNAYLKSRYVHHLLYKTPKPIFHVHATNPSLFHYCPHQKQPTPTPPPFMVSAMSLVDTEQIVPAEYLTLVPSKPHKYRKLGSYALIGLPTSYSTRFIDPGEFQSKYNVVIGGENFGCGSSREHAPVALGAAGVKVVVAESYARIFFKNSVATGEIYPLESERRLCDECSTGDVVTIELRSNLLINHTTGKEYKLKPIGDAGPVIHAGGIFAYARKTWMISSVAPSS